MIEEEISGWLDDGDQLNSIKFKRNKEEKIDKAPLHQNLRSYSLCQKKDDTEKLLISKSNLFSDKENSSQFLKCRIQKKQNSTIEELKKVMEFLSINEQYKYETHRAFDPNDDRFIKQQQQLIEKQKQQQELKKNKFKLQLDIKDNYQTIPKSRRQLQPLSDVQQVQKINSERSQNNQIQQSGIHDSKSQTQTKFKFPKFIIQQQKYKKQHYKTDEFNGNKDQQEQQAKHFIQINRIFSNNNLTDTKQSLYTPKSVTQAKYQIQLQQTISNINQARDNGYAYDLLYRKTPSSTIQENKEKQKQLKLLEIALKCKNIK
ncbi:unnamed protein product [Paramecium primaurelia]|uniref:Uncharacterized protein n=1 Tax=Paramecium primaurelia TaxID=5886 RepID=A0A8S1P3S2_PARPR|nr:unnamed protein product [Paramecium primaurelia]